MRRRWKWDFELDETRPAADPTRPKRAGTLRPARDLRRLGWIGLLLFGLFVVIVAAVAASHRHNPRRLDPRGPGVGRLNAVQSSASRGAELDQGRAVGSVLAYTPFVRAGGDRRRDIALTFDDGPGPYTPRVLDVLERYHVRATFFAIGEMERYFSASTTRELRDGDVVGDHTETHPEMARLSAPSQHEQLLDQLARVELLGGQRPTLFRPPYGSFDATTMLELRSLHLLMILWSVDAGDYLRPGVHQIVRHVLAGARPGAIVLLHDAGGDRSQTIAALPRIISRLRARGFRLVTVPQLLADDPPSPDQPLPTSLNGD
jgi:peptidoglycan/xylan/chitin deacetylase (PgdA/CDA1 family)